MEDIKVRNRFQIIKYNKFSFIWYVNCTIFGNGLKDAIEKNRVFPDEPLS